MYKILTILSLISLTCFSQITDTFNKYDSLLMKEINMYRYSKKLDTLIPSMKMEIEITNIHLKDIEDTLNYRIARFDKFKKDNDITNRRSVPENLMRKYLYERAYKNTSDHPSIINSNENLSMIPISCYKSNYIDYTIIYQFHRFMDSKGINIGDFIKQYINFFGVKWVGDKVEYNFNFKSSVEYKEFKTFVYKDGFYIDKNKFDFSVGTLCHSPQSFRLAYSDYIKLKTIYIDTIGLDYDYLFNEETTNDERLLLTKIILTGFVYSPKHNKILLTENIYDKPLRNISTGSIIIDGWIHTLVNFQNDSNVFFNIRDIRNRRYKLNIKKNKKKK